MDQSHFQNLPPESTSQKSKELFNGGQTVVIYTVLSILNRMRQTLGLEVMLEYIETYLQLTARREPEIKNAVTKALNLMNVEKIYREAVSAKDE